MKRLIFTTTLLCAALASTTASAATLTFSNNSGFAVSSTDLINGKTATISGSGLTDRENLQSDTTGAALTNGGFGSIGIDPGPNPGMSIVNSNTTLTYSLGTNAAGYDVSQIDTFAGWRDTGRSHQDYSVFFSFVNDPTAFILEYVVGNQGTDNDTKVSFFRPDGTAIGTGVASVQFAFGNVQNGFVGYRELDVIGTATGEVPEPAPLALLGVGLLGFAASRRKSAK